MSEGEKVKAVYDVRKEEQGFVLYCNGSVLLTPAGKTYAMPSLSLAEALADEWRERDELIEREGKKGPVAFLPLTQLAATTIDVIDRERPRIIDQLVEHAATELLCHRDPSRPDLILRQQEVWQPLLEWCAGLFGALLVSGEGIMPIQQSPEAIAALHEAVSSYDDFSLMALSHAVEATGSLVLGLALLEGEVTASEALHAAELEAEFQITSWGSDPVLTARFDSVRADLELVGRWLKLLFG